MTQKNVSQPHSAVPDSDRQDRPMYRKPVMIPLGELVQGSGRCASGSSPTGAGGNCKTGSAATSGNCISGVAPGKNCNSGSSR